METNRFLVQPNGHDDVPATTTYYDFTKDDERSRNKKRNGTDTKSNKV